MHADGHDVGLETLHEPRLLAKGPELEVAAVPGRREDLHGGHHAFSLGRGNAAGEQLVVVEQVAEVVHLLLVVDDELDLLFEVVRHGQGFLERIDCDGGLVVQLDIVVALSNGRLHLLP